MNSNTLQNGTRRKTEELYCIRRCERDYFGRRVEYALYCNGADGTRFRISIKDRLEEAVGEVRGSFSEVAALFDRIVCGEVAPYVLCEILDDFSHEKE